MMYHRFSCKRFARSLVLAVVNKVIDKLLNVSACYLDKPYVTDCGIYSVCKLFHSLIRGVAEIDFCVSLFCNDDVHKILGTCVFSVCDFLRGQVRSLTDTWGLCFQTPEVYPLGRYR